MSDLIIPSRLQKKLNRLTSLKQHSPVFIETGEKCFSMASVRLEQLVKKHKAIPRYGTEPVANHPIVLYLLPQEYLEQALSHPEPGLCTSFTCLSENQSPREDLSALTTPTGVVVTTPQRAIDHIRRDNIFLSEVKSVLAVYGFPLKDGETMENLVTRQKAFLDDLRYVLTKTSPKVPVECYVDDFSHLARQPHEFATHPVLLTRPDWEDPLCPLEFRVSPQTTARTVSDLLYTLQSPHFFIIHRDDLVHKALDTLLQKETPPLSTTSISFGQPLSIKGPKAPLSGMAVAFGLELEEIATLIQQLRSWSVRIEKLVCIITPQQESGISQSKETTLMDNTTKNTPEAMEVIAGKIQMIASKVRIDSNPDELDSYKRLFKKHVPFMLRGYFTAYLLREVLGGSKTAPTRDRSDSKMKKPKSEQDDGAAVHEARPKRKADLENADRKPTSENNNDANGNGTTKPEAVIPEGAKTIYLNIGKMKRLYAKELSLLIQTELGITREDIFSIRIHDKYSFITLTAENAENAIAKLNGMEIKGRIAAVSYSNKE